MDNFKLASKLALRIPTALGSLSVEQLWTLTVSQLDTLAVSLEEALEKSGRKSFVVKTTEKNKLAKLKFDIVLDVLTTKMEEETAAATARDTKAHNQKILSLIADKKENSLRDKTVEELEAMLQ